MHPGDRIVEQGQVDAVIKAVDGGAAVVAEVHQVAAVVFGTGHGKGGHFKLFAQLPLIGGIDVLGVGRKTEGHAAQNAAEHGHRCGRVGKMGVQMRDPSMDHPVVDEVAGLQEMLEGGGFAGAPETPQGQAQRPGIGRGTACRQVGIVLEQLGQTPADDGFGQIVHPGADFPDAGVAEGFPGSAHGKDVDRDALLFQKPDFIGDEGFGDAREPFEHHAEDRRISRPRHSLYSGRPECGCACCRCR